MALSRERTITPQDSRNMRAQSVSPQIAADKQMQDALELMILENARKDARARMLAEVRAKAADLQAHGSPWEEAMQIALNDTVYDDCPVEDVNLP